MPFSISPNQVIFFFAAVCLHYCCSSAAQWTETQAFPSYTNPSVPIKGPGVGLGSHSAVAGGKAVASGRGSVGPVPPKPSKAAPKSVSKVGESSSKV